MADPTAQRPRLRLAIVSDRSASAVARLAERLQREVPAAQVAGLVYAPCTDPGPKPQEPGPMASSLLRFFHACPRPSPRQESFDVFALGDLCRAAGIAMVTAATAGAAEAQNLLKSLDLDLVISYGGSLSQELWGACARKGTVFAEGALLADAARGADAEQLEVSVRYHPASGTCIALGGQRLPVESYDTSVSLRLKLDLLARDLLVQAVGQLCSNGKGSALVEALDASDMAGHLPVRLSPRRAARFPNWRQRPAWKLLARTLLFGPMALLRNWYRRATGSFPVVILYHHLVSDRPHRMGIATEMLLRHVRFLKRHYRLVSMQEALELLRSGRVDSPTVVLSLDDGYADNFINLRAVTEEERVSATLFVCTEHQQSGREFAHDANRGQHGFPPLTWQQVAQLRASGLEFGSHTRTHFDCGSTDAARLEHEIRGSRSDLEQNLGRISYFSFPWGNPQNMSQPAVELARRAYPHVFSGCGGANFPVRDGQLWHLRRRCHTNHLWELELAVQGALNLEFLGERPNLEESFA